MFDLVNFRNCSTYPTQSCLNNTALAHVEPGAEVRINKLISSSVKPMDLCFRGDSSLENIEINCAVPNATYSLANKIYSSDSHVKDISFCLLQSHNSNIEESSFGELTVSDSTILNSDIRVSEIYLATLNQVAAYFVMINNNIHIANHTRISTNYTYAHVELQSVSAKEIIIYNNGANFTLGSDTNTVECQGVLNIENNATFPRHINSIEAREYCTIDENFKPLPIPSAYKPPVIPSQNSHKSNPNSFVLGASLGSVAALVLLVLYKLTKSKSNTHQAAESEMVNLNTSSNSSALLNNI